MEFEKFTAIVKDEVEKRLGESNRVVKINDVIKNNGVKLRGLSIIEDGVNISPTIYLDNFYGAYERGSMTMLRIIDEVLQAYNRNKIDRSVDMKYFLKYETVKNRITYKIINTKKNEELLKIVPHIEWLDLSIVFQVIVSVEESNTASILIHNTHAKLWGVTAGELYNVAKINTQKKLGYHLMNLDELVQEMAQSFGAEFDEDDMRAVEDSDIEMYVLTNNNRIDGAACIIYPNILEDLSIAMGRKGFYVIPSSVHEIIIVPSDDTIESDQIKGMVKEINDTQVREEDILSYSLYYYSPARNKLSCV